MPLSKPSSPRLRRWHVAASLALIVVAGGAAGGWHARTVHAALFERVGRRLEGNAAPTEAAVERWIEERRYDAATIAAEVIAAEPRTSVSGRPANRELDRLLSRLRAGHGYMAVWVFDDQGHVLSAATPARPEPVELAAAIAAAGDSTPRVSAPFATADGTALCFALSSRHAGGLPEVDGAGARRPFVVVLRSNPFGSLVPLVTAGGAAGGTERGALIGRVGDELRLLSGGSPSRVSPAHGVLSWRDAPLPLRAAFSAGAAHGTYRDFDGHVVVAGARRVRGTDWAVVRQVDGGEIETAYRKELRAEALLLAAVLAAIAFGAFAVARSERARRLREVAVSEARLADTLRTSLDAVVAFDETQRITLFNAAAERTYGYTADQALGRSVDMLCPPALRAHQMAGLRRFIESDAPSLFAPASERAVGLRADGTQFPAEIALAKGEADGHRICTIVVRDITERVRHLAEREESLSLLRATLESTADGILVVDVAGRTTAFNRKFLDVWGIADHVAHEREDAKFLSVALSCARDPDAFRARVQAVYADPSAESYDLIELVDGRMIERVSRPQRLAGRVIGRVWSFRDVTARELAAIALRRSEASNRAFVERSPFGICRITADGMFMSANPALVAMLGYPTEDALLRLDLMGLYADPAERVELLRRHESGEDAVVGFETRWRRADGGVIPVRVSSQIVRDARGACVHYVAYVEDLAPLRAAEQALRQAEKLAAVGQFVSGVAHELNNPLAAVLLFTESLLEESAIEHERETLGLLREQACRARAIVRDLLSFVRGAQGDFSVVDAADMVADAVRALEPQAAAVGSRLELVDAPPLGWVRVDRVAIGQVLTNLVVNAIHAAPLGTIRVRADVVAGAVHVSVEDEGPGIPQDVLPRVFEPFFTTKPVGVGTGLGLSVSLGIAEHHGGTLRAGNRSDRPGARVVLTLPLVAAPAAAAAPPVLHVPNVQRDDRPRRVLLVDDEAAIRRALSRFFSRRRWSVDEAVDGHDALARLLAAEGGAAHAYDLVISDLRMPGLSGAELHDRLADERPDLLPRLVFSTGDLVSPDAAAFVARTDCAVLEKPFHFSNLDALIQRVTHA